MLFASGPRRRVLSGGHARHRYTSERGRSQGGEVSGASDVVTTAAAGTRLARGSRASRPRVARTRCLARRPARTNRRLSRDRQPRFGIVCTGRPRLGSPTSTLSGGPLSGRSLSSARRRVACDRVGEDARVSVAPRVPPGARKEPRVGGHALLLYACTGHAGAVTAFLCLR